MVSTANRSRQLRAWCELLEREYGVKTNVPLLVLDVDDAVSITDSAKSRSSSENAVIILNSLFMLLTKLHVKAEDVALLGP